MAQQQQQVLSNKEDKWNEVKTKSKRKPKHATPVPRSSLWVLVPTSAAATDSSMRVIMHTDGNTEDEKKSRFVLHRNPRGRFFPEYKNKEEPYIIPLSVQQMETVIPGSSSRSHPLTYRQPDGKTVTKFVNVAFFVSTKRAPAPQLARRILGIEDALRSCKYDEERVCIRQLWSQLTGKAEPAAASVGSAQPV